jgi:hypothetical protein
VQSIGEEVAAGGGGAAAVDAEKGTELRERLKHERRGRRRAAYSAATAPPNIFIARCGSLLMAIVTSSP